MALGHRARRDDYRLNEILARNPAQHRLQRRRAGLPRCQRISAARRACASPAHQPPSGSSAIVARILARGAAIGASCASGEVNRARRDPCVKTMSPATPTAPSGSSGARALARCRHDRSAHSPHRCHPRTPETSPASIRRPGEIRLEQYAPIAQHVGRNGIPGQMTQLHAASIHRARPSRELNPPGPSARVNHTAVRQIHSGRIRFVFLESTIAAFGPLTGVLPDLPGSLALIFPENKTVLASNETLASALAASSGANGSHAPTQHHQLRAIGKTLATIERCQRIVDRRRSENHRRQFNWIVMCGARRWVLRWQRVRQRDHHQSAYRARRCRQPSHATVSST